MRARQIVYLSLVGAVAGVSWLPWLAFSIGKLGIEALQNYCWISGPPGVLAYFAERLGLATLDLGSYPYRVGFVFAVACFLYYALFFAPLFFAMKPESTRVRFNDKLPLTIAVIGQGLVIAFHIYLSVLMLFMIRA